MADSIEYLSVYNAHNGESVKIPKPLRFATLQKLKEYLMENFTDGIIATTDNIFLLTSFGLKVQFTMINELTDLYLYDRRLFQRNADQKITSHYLSRTLPQGLSYLGPQLPKYLSPSGLSGQALSKSIRELDLWNESIGRELKRFDEAIDSLVREINVIFRALNIIFQFATNFLKAAEKTFNQQYSHVKLLGEKSLHGSWRAHFEALRKFDTIKLNNTHVSLIRFLDERELQQAAGFVARHLPAITLSLNELSSTLNGIHKDRMQVDAIIEKLRKESTSKFLRLDADKSTLLKDAEFLLAQARKDFLSTQTDVSNSLPELYEVQVGRLRQALEKLQQLRGHFESLQSFKANLANESTAVFENIAVQQMKASEVKSSKNLATSSSASELSSQLETLLKIKEFEDLLSMTLDLPLLFGFSMIEIRRQYEWHDFYAKGIVTTTTEQLSGMIEQERSFQKLWIKKFGKFIEKIDASCGFDAHIPSIDVTLVNSGASDLAPVFKWLGDLRVEREDISSYIKMVRAHAYESNVKHASLLEKNFRDLVSSTNRLKKATKVLASVGSQKYDITGSVTLQLITEGNNVEDDSELNVIKGLRSRIKKLEDLLHQQQYKNLNGWPVLNSVSKPPNTNQSLLLKNVSLDKPSNPLKLLHRSGTTSRQENTTSTSLNQNLDASATIDKHLDNIRLRRELSELHLTLRKTTESKLDFERQMEAQSIDIEQRLTEQLGIQKREADRYEHENANLRLEIERLRTTNNELARRTESLEHELQSHKKSADASIQSKIDELRILNEQNRSLSKELEDTKTMNLELLSNMQSKESDFGNERNSLQRRIKELVEQMEEKSEDFENLMELTQAKLIRAEDLLATSEKYLKETLMAVYHLLLSNLDYFRDSCVILESMGLLLVKDVNPESGQYDFRIRRVKGLRSRKNSEGAGEHGDEIVSKSLVVQELLNDASWISEFGSLIQELKISETASSEVNNPNDSTNTLTTNELIATNLAGSESHSEPMLQFIALCDRFVIGESKASRIDEFIKTISFTENVQLQSLEEGVHLAGARFFPNGIIKRFNDVEGFAKKLTKENRSKSNELDVLEKASGNKISVNNFRKGDMVLFLPTLIDQAESENLASRALMPWTAFNINAPNYFLSTAQRDDDFAGKEWVVARIKLITDHLVTKENALDMEHNPFMLSVGTRWFTIVTSEAGAA